MSDFMQVYADNAATTRISETALNAMLPWLGEKCGNPSNLHSFGQEAAQAVYDARAAVAGVIGAQACEIYFTSGGSEADNQAIISAARAGAAKDKKHIIFSAFEHHAVLHTLDALRREGFEVTLLDVHSDGLVRVEELESALRGDTALRGRLVSGLSKIPHSKINGDQSRCLPGTLNMCFEGIEGESLLLLLDGFGIAASSGSACTSGSLDPSHVLLALGLPHELAHGSLRLSLSEYNTAEEIEHIIDCVPKAVERLREMSPVWEELEKGSRPHCA